MVPLKGFLEKLDEQRHCIEVETLTHEFDASLKEAQKKWTELLKEADGKIKRLLKDLEMKAKVHFERIEERMKVDFANQVRMNLLARKFEYNITRRLPLELINEFREVMHNHKTHAKSLEKMRNEIELRVSKAHQDREILLRDLLRTTEESFSRVFQNLNDDFSVQAEIPKWSLIERNADISVNNKLIERKEIWTSGFVCAFADTIVSMSPPFTHRWIIKIRKIPGMIDVGMCLGSLVKRNGYIYTDWAQTGHGVYAIGSLGATYHHVQPLQNLSRQSFEFDVGDQIQVDYNLVDGLLTFTKNNREGVYRMEVPPSPPDDCYRPCVFLWKVGDSVELVDPSKRISK